ncbi:TatD family hydrolase [Sporolactobacillus sp. KGMB 08714]|uniref:TatD family hydrolase n=1 Tax=Sporolactobacillus sp. KGMB 08714 TaxID=3064704 RepID=UPI002FBDD62A
MMGRLIDTHFHLDYYRNHKELYETINKLKQFTLCMTNSPGIFVSCKRIYNETKYIRFALGFHPQQSTLSVRDFSNFLVLAKNVRYIGEVGLDFSSSRYLPKNQQLDYFEQIVKFCAENNKLMSVHLRKSENAGIDIIKKYKPSKCIIHWFTGSSTQLNALVALNCYFSINTNMTHSKKTKPKLPLIPTNRLLVESDGPFTKVNGNKFTPKLLSTAYQSIAEYYANIDFASQIYINFKELLQK